VDEPVVDEAADVAGPDLAQVDRYGQRLLIGSAHVLAGLMATGLLRHARRPDTLIGILAPDVPPGPDRDRLVFIAGAAAGLHAGQRRRAGRWDPAEERQAADDLYAAGWAAMAVLPARAATVGHSMPPWAAPQPAGDQP
jgi:hypothetical protein